MPTNRDFDGTMQPQADALLVFLMVDGRSWERRLRGDRAWAPQWRVRLKPLPIHKPTTDLGYTMNHDICIHSTRDWFDLVRDSLRLTGWPVLPRANKVHGK